MNPHIMKVIFNKVAFVYVWERMDYLYMVVGELLIYTGKKLKIHEVKSLPHIIKKKTN